MCSYVLIRKLPTPNAFTEPRRTGDVNPGSPGNKAPKRLFFTMKSTLAELDPGSA